MDTHKAQTVPDTNNSKPKSRGQKRIIVCCDGTWQDGIDKNYRWQYSNILKIARIVEKKDDRFDPPIDQVVYYQSGIGSENNLYSYIVEGGIGEGLGEKVQEAYAFIAHNYLPGDEIFLFGFSRGAYTARMVAMFIGAIGILDKRQMDHFAEIFVWYQKLGKNPPPAEKEQLNKSLAPFISPDAPGKRLAQPDGAKFSVKCVAVFDTVGSIGLPGELVGKSSSTTQLFGFNNLLLGTHVERAYQALALNEMRDDFSPAKFEQTEEGTAKGQVLKQCWFSGAHSDVGGGYEYHDLSDMSLTWMMANVGDLLVLDFKYLKSLFKPAAPWGEQIPHDTKTGIFELAKTSNRAPPIPHNPVTHETIHPSVLHQKVLRPDISSLVQAHPDVVWTLLPLETEVKAMWPFVPGARPSTDKVTVQTAKEEQSEQKSFLKDAMHQMQGMVGGQQVGPEEQAHKPFKGVKLVGTLRKNTWFGALIDGITE